MPEVPTLLFVNHLSGQNAVISWIPLTPDQARGLLNFLEIAYEPTKGLHCSLHMNNSSDSEVVLVRQNLTFEQSTANMTGLEPNRDYCVTIQVGTSGGESGFSDALKLPRESDSTDNYIIGSLINLVLLPSPVKLIKK